MAEQNAQSRNVEQVPQRVDWWLVFMLSMVALVLVLSNVAQAACDHLYPSGKPIEVPNTIELCSSFYVVRYDTTAKAAVLVSEVFDPTLDPIPRKNAFRHDARLPADSRAEIADYYKSGYDMGHMAPAGDAKTHEAMYDSFLLSNMTPQVPSLNRESWRLLEGSVRKMCNSSMYVVTVALYPKPAKTIGYSHIPVPSRYYKVVYSSKSPVRVFTAENVENAKVVETTEDSLNLDIDYAIK